MEREELARREEDVDIKGGKSRKTSIKSVQPCRPKLYSIAGSTISTFSDVHVAAMRWKNEARQRITAEVDGRKVDLLYGTGATSSCLTKDTPNKLFPSKKLQSTGARCQAAGKVDLGVIR